ncbi:MAG: hypothetical protein HFH65_00990 [Lachnospiraceae bacterium]|nr:hypothetical protein [Lachnospiraceae bacterium]
MIVLITATIQPQIKKRNIIADSFDREKQYKDSVIYLLDCKKVQKIIFCENSGYNYEGWEEIENYAKRNNKDIELLSFNGNIKEIKKRGKGYGEGEIIKYVIQNSSFLKNEKNFVKITGRLTVRNLDKILFKIDQNKIYIKTLAVNYKSNLADTRFFIMPVNLYRCLFLELYQSVEDEKGKYIEKIYTDFIIKNNITVSDFPIFPIISGVSGSTGRIYHENKFKFYIKNFLLKIGFYKIKNK